MSKTHNSRTNEQVKILASNHSNNSHKSLIAPSNRYIVAKVDDRLITFPDVLVSEIMIVDRNAILPLPFYGNAIVGVIHHQANIMPLILLRLLIGEHRTLITESLTVVRLSQVADKLNSQKISGIGVIVDRVIGSLIADEYQTPQLNQTDLSNVDLSDFLGSSIAATKKINQTVANIKENEYTPIEIILSNIPENIWQPQRWHEYSVG